jgi:hypothetical protein
VVYQRQHLRLRQLGALMRLGIQGASRRLRCCRQRGMLCQTGWTWSRSHGVAGCSALVHLITHQGSPAATSRPRSRPAAAVPELAAAVSSSRQLAHCPHPSHHLHPQPRQRRRSHSSWMATATSLMAQATPLAPASRARCRPTRARPLLRCVAEALRRQACGRAVCGLRSGTADSFHQAVWRRWRASWMRWSAKWTGCMHRSKGGGAVRRLALCCICMQLQGLACQPPAFSGSVRVLAPCTGNMPWVCRFVTRAAVLRLPADGVGGGGW